MDNIIEKPVITEKSLTLAGKGWYTFAVNFTATKERIAAEIAKFYKVKVLSVRTANMHGKIHKAGRKMKLTRKPDWKKAYVLLQSGQKIDVFHELDKQPEAKT